ncbi:MAG: hypothetical protein B0D91_15195 [Oceanospirillales bacterium LUC14_002_19_P2]|nr:MAG: hypothetical protein B0D91_15195 [Oceanospirillales bacterium LUC14_002_19_P2]
MGILVLLGGCMSDLTGYSYSRGEIASQAWVDAGTVIVVEVVGRTTDLQGEVGFGEAPARADNRRILMTIQLDTGAHISIEQAVELDYSIHAGDRVHLVSEGGVTRVVTATPLKNQ